jgi:hypothetical protein
MSNRINASICLSDIGNKVKEGHSSIKTGNNGKKYVAVTIWINDTSDKFGNNVSIQLNSTQEKRDAEGKFYVGNGKTADAVSSAAPVSAGNEGSDLPF